MSTRHRSQELAPQARVELRAHAKSERQRINSELHAVASLVSGGLEPDDTSEPGAAWKPTHHHDAERAKAKSLKPRIRHWKMKAWKRRTAERQAKNALVRMQLEQA
jgi:hypothetical protein